MEFVLIKIDWEELKSLPLLKLLSPHIVSPKHRPNIQENTTRIPRFQNQNFRTVASFLCRYRSLQLFPRIPVFSKMYITTSEAHEVSRTRILPHCGFFVGKLQFHSHVYSKVSRVTFFLQMTRLEDGVSLFETCAPYLPYYFMC